MYEHFEVVALHKNSYGNPRSRLARINNSIVDEMNKEVKLPKFLVMFLDCDIIELAEIFDCGVKKIMPECLQWLQRTITQNIETRRDDLKKKKPGALFDSREPGIVWIEAVPRPKNSTKKEVYSLVGKYNEILHSVANQHSIILSLETVNELNCFDSAGRLTPIEKERYWLEVNYLLRKLLTKDDKSLPAAQHTSSESKKYTTTQYSHRTQSKTTERKQHRAAHDHGHYNAIGTTVTMKMTSTDIMMSVIIITAITGFINLRGVHWSTLM